MNCRVSVGQVEAVNNPESEELSQPEIQARKRATKTDSVWYGSPQWQIDAFWCFQIPEDLRKKYGYPELTVDAKRKILGLNSARLYGIKGVESGNLQQRFKPVPKDYEKRMTRT